jgi:hypothetical protein
LTSNLIWFRLDSNMPDPTTYKEHPDPVLPTKLPDEILQACAWAYANKLPFTVWERIYLEYVVKAERNQSRAADLLGYTRKTVKTKMDKYLSTDRKVGAPWVSDQPEGQTGSEGTDLKPALVGRAAPVAPAHTPASSGLSFEDWAKANGKVLPGRKGRTP